MIFTIFPGLPIHAQLDSRQVPLQVSQGQLSLLEYP